MVSLPGQPQEQPAASERPGRRQLLRVQQRREGSGQGDRRQRPRNREGAGSLLISHPHRNRQGQEVLGLAPLQAVGAGPSRSFLLRTGEVTEGYCVKCQMGPGGALTDQMCGRKGAKEIHTPPPPSHWNFWAHRLGETAILVLIFLNSPWLGGEKGSLSHCKGRTQRHMRKRDGDLKTALKSLLG